ncbi:MAG TPA: hypothetical protein VHF89_15000 [Solirubrobacteraceae bacterium]|nr:hypothetical protein [Solirubrobacteraceae bacterium]
MGRNGILALAAVVLVAIGVPVGVALVGGGGGDDDAPAPASGTHFPEGIDADNAPEHQRTTGDGDGARGRERSGGQAGKGKRREGPPREYPTSRNVAYPNDVTASGSELARVIEGHLGAIAPKAEQLTLIGADCRANGACTARYVSGPHGGGRILRDAAVILRRAFRRSSVRSVRLYVHEPRGRRSRGVEPMALQIIACRRADHPTLEWSALTERQLVQRCTVRDQSPGKLGARIRKGQLSERDASLGREGGAGGPAGAPGPSAPPGAKPAGTPAPRNVNKGGRVRGGGR